ncbi:MAG: DUF1440 domain-containing protein [Methylibium sp.]|nr:DUF1440 domain-containing protein [Methylibium sp.]
MEQRMNETGTETGVAATALMGAAAGAIAVWALDRVDWFMWNRLDARTRTRTVSVRPAGEPPSHALVSKIEKAAGLNPTDRQHDLAGDITHYMIGIGPAAGYAVMRDKLPGRGPMRGLLYGLGVFLMQDEAFNTATGLGAKPQAYPWQAHARGLIAHLVYGVTTELVLNAMERAVESARSGGTAGGTGPAMELSRDSNGKRVDKGTETARTDEAEIQGQPSPISTH